MKTQAMVAAAGVLVLASMSVQANVLVFTDSFDNNVATQIGVESPSYWMNNRDTSSSNFSYVTDESTLSGSLTLSALRTNTGSQPNQMLRAANLDGVMNFWTGRRTFEFTGLSFSRSGTTGGAWDGNMYFDIYSKSTAYGSAQSSIGLRLTSAGVLTFGVTENTSVTSATMNNGYGATGTNGFKAINSLSMLTSAQAAANLTGSDVRLELVLDGTGGDESHPGQLYYSIRLKYATGSASTNDSSNNGWIDSSDTGRSALTGWLTTTQTSTLLNYWLADNGVTLASDAKGAVALSVRDTSSGAASTSVNTTLKVGALNVYAVPEPASLSLVGLGTGLMFWRRR